MKKITRKVSKRISVIFLILFIGIVTANWFMTNRLEKFLNEVLQERVSEATNGFYNLSFSKLSVGFFNGELLIEGVSLHPDTTTFKQLHSTDSLPNYYLNIDIGSIYFRGINLTWTRNYKTLNFELFEIKNSDIKIFDSYYKELDEGKQDSTITKSRLNIYELIAPYISSLKVKEMNLENANISYWAKDLNSTTRYALNNINFHTYGFRLDGSSFQTGRFLYSDNVKFSANQPQILLQSNSMILKTERILFDTRDSIITIDNIKLFPPDSLWRSVAHQPISYLSADVNSIKVKGLAFERKKAKILMNVREFDITNSDIQYYSSNPILLSDKIDSIKESKDTINLSWSLYSIISPLVHSMNVDQIKIDNARLKYSYKNDKNITDIYTLDRFGFLANNFKIDSTADLKQKLLYSDNFKIDANDINALISSRNYRVNVKKMLLDTQKGHLKIDKASVSPLKKTTDTNYLEGMIDYVSIDGLVYNKSINVSKLIINQPNLQFIQFSTKKTEKTENSIEEHLKNLELFQSLVNYLLIQRIELNNANLSFKDQIKNETYNLNNLNLFAEDLRIDKNAKKDFKQFYQFTNWGFSFMNFDNTIANQKYRLQIKKGIFSSKDGKLLIENLNLTPRITTETNTQTSPISVKFSTPLLKANGLIYMKGKQQDSVRLTTLQIESPQIEITKKSTTQKPERSNKNINYTNLFIDDLISNSIKIKIQNDVDKDSTELTLESLKISKLSKDNNDMYSTVFLNIDSINIESAQNKQNIKAEAEKIQLENASIKLYTNDSHIRLGKAYLGKPSANIVNKHPYKIKNKEKTSKENIYEFIGKYANKIKFNDLDIEQANINYKHISNQDTIKRNKINQTSLHLYGFEACMNTEFIKVDDISFKTENLSLPIDNEFYTLHIGQLNFDQKQQNMLIDNIYLEPAYTKTEFAYRHPMHKDWFDLKVQNIILSGIDIPKYLNDRILRINKLKLNDTYLENYKNQQIDIPHNPMPLIYQNFQNLGLKVYIDSLDVNNFNVNYEELARRGTVPGKIFFTNIYGKISNFTNKETNPSQVYILNANGKFMESGYFKARWIVPVSSTYDHFQLSASLESFNFTELNQLITPLFPAKISRGNLDKLIFNASSSSKGALVDMTLLYNDLNIELMKADSGEMVTNKLQSRLANLVIRNNNPRKPKSKPKIVKQLYVERDPYHSTFNYFWQMLRPPVIESIGISRGVQNTTKGFSAFFIRLQNRMGFGEDQKKIQKKNK